MRSKTSDKVVNVIKEEKKLVRDTIEKYSKRGKGKENVE